MLFWNRSGEPESFDPLSMDDRKNNAHTLIIGRTGAGKSASLVYMLQKMMAFYRPKVYIIDVGNSFGLFGDHAKKFGLSVHKITLNMKSDVQLPPFANVTQLVDKKDYLQIGVDEGGRGLVSELLKSTSINDDEEEIEARDILGEAEMIAVLMITGGEQTEMDKLTRANRMAIRRSILLAAENVLAAGEELVRPEDIANAIGEIAKSDDYREYARELREMADAMFLFCDGLNGRLFNRKGGELWPDSDITIVDLNEAATDKNKDTLAVAYTSLMQHIGAEVERDQMLSRQTIVLTDEGHIITKNPLLMPYVVSITKMWRKLGAWYWIGTQNVADFPGSAETLLNMIEWWYCLNGTADEVEQISRFKDLTAEEKAMMLSCRKEPRKYTEGVVLADSVKTLFRNVPPALSLALAQTESEEKSKRQTQPYELAPTVPYDWASAEASAIASARASITDKMSALEFIINSNELSCVKLTLEGIQFWLVTRFFGPIPIVTVEFSLQVSHYNPDFIVSTYPRLGASPILEADLLYDLVQTEVAQGVMKLITGDSHGLMSRENEFGGHYAESGGAKRSMFYSEAEVIGHPGNVFSLAALFMSGNSGRLFNAPAEIAQDIVTTPIQLVQQAQDVGTEMVVNNNTVSTTTSEWQDWSAPGLGDTSVWKDDVLIPIEFDRYIRGIIGAYETFQDLESLVDQAPSISELGESVGDILEDPITEISEAAINAPDLQEAIGVVDDETIDIGAVGTILTIIQDPGLNPVEIEELEEELEALGLDPTQVQETLDGIEELDARLEGENIKEGGGMLFSLCPSDATILAPYYLPGLNVVSWRFGLPEMAFRNSYAMPYSNSNLFIGEFEDIDVAVQGTSVPNWNTWSNIYPRSGWVNNSDPVKARAAAAFRAAHVVTRPGQAHVYKYAEKKTNGFKRADTRAGLEPNDLESGAWQMMHPKEGDEGTLLQDSSIETDVNLWRHYECAVKPTGDIVEELFYLDLGGIEILH